MQRTGIACKCWNCPSNSQVHSISSKITVFQVGKDGHASLVKDALAAAGVRLDHMNTVKGPTGHAVVMLQPGGINSIVLVQGANVSWPRLEDGIGRLTTTVQQLIRRAGAVLLQREVPDSVNLEAAKVRTMSGYREGYI